MVQYAVGRQIYKLVGTKIVTQPLDHNASIGSNLTLSVDANGSGPLTFEWFKGTQCSLMLTVARR